MQPADIVDQLPFVGVIRQSSLPSRWCHVYSASRHHIACHGATGQPVHSVIITEDSTVIACFGTMYLFVWSNCTTAAVVIVGKELPMYGFSLANTVHDLWQAGLYPLSFFVCLFSGVYPYAKLLCIVVYSVILQQPQSRVVRMVDVLGKFSFLDSFVMMTWSPGR